MSLLFLSLLLAAGCSSSVIIPESMRGDWYPENGEGIALRFEQNGDQGDIFWSTSNKSVQGPKEWSGPLSLQSAGENSWSFELKQVVKTEATNTRITEPPSIKQNIKHIIDQNGRVLERSYDQMEGGHKVTVTIEGNDKLILDGLWIRAEVNKWNKDGSPEKVDISALKTSYIKMR